MDEEAAAANPFFPGRVAHGYLLVSWAAGLFVDPEPGPVLANYGLENLRFLTPVSPGDEIRVELTAKQITPRETDEYGEVRWDAVIRNQSDELVATYDVLTLVAKELATRPDAGLSGCVQAVERRLATEVVAPALVALGTLRRRRVRPVVTTGPAAHLGDDIAGLVGARVTSYEPASGPSAARRTAVAVEGLPARSWT